MRACVGRKNRFCQLVVTFGAEQVGTCTLSLVLFCSCMFDKFGGISGGTCNCGGGDTLGDGCTLGDGISTGIGISGGVIMDVGGVIDVGRSSTLFKIVAISRSALRVLSPTCKEGVVVEGGDVKMVIMPVAACFKKSSRCISGNLIALGKKVTVFTSFSLLVLGKKHFIHI